MFRRFLFDKIDWDQRLVLLLGSRGTGKTTLLLQKMKETGDHSIYLHLDDFYFEGNRLILLLEDLYKKGIRYYFLDEAHRYAHWSADVKSFYDTYQDAHLYLTGSSILQLEKGQSDLSRRSIIYRLPGLSLREFIQLEYGVQMEILTLDQVIKDHHHLSAEISDRMDILKYFKNYLAFGYYPFYQEGKKFYPARLQEILRIVIEMDIGPYENLNFSSLQKMEKLLSLISEHVPFIPNVSKLAQKLDLSRNSLLKMFHLLERAGMILLLSKQVGGISVLQKPEKIYLHHPNLNVALSQTIPNPGTIRETFFFNQLQVLHQVSAPKYGDFFVDQELTFEIGGPNKGMEQIQGVSRAYIAADNLKFGQGKKIPLWMFGLLY
jgi:hypothetical protein